MTLVEYSLFRVKLLLPRQPSLLHYEVTRSEVFLAALEEKPDSQVRQGYTWHIGNVQLFSPNAGYFAIGRTRQSTIEKFNFETGNFVEEELETSPYTHCVFDAQIGIVGIARKPALAPTPDGIARRLGELLSKTRQVRENAIDIEISPIPNPDNFLREIREAYGVLQFSATFHRPNPFDADEYFQRPLSVYLEAVDGERGRTIVSGKDLDRAAVAEVVRSTAATGNDATAKIRRTRGAGAVSIRLGGSTVGVSYDEDIHDPKIALNDLRVRYARVREEDARS